jgi:putative addiction module antidote
MVKPGEHKTVQSRILKYAEENGNSLQECNNKSIISYYVCFKSGTGTMELKLRKVGNSLALIVPKRVRENMGVAEGDAVYLTEIPGGYKISPYDPEFSQQMELARKVQSKHRDALHELAK